MDRSWRGWQIAIEDGPSGNTGPDWSLSAKRFSVECLCAGSGRKPFLCEGFRLDNRAGTDQATVPPGGGVSG